MTFETNKATIKKGFTKVQSKNKQNRGQGRLGGGLKSGASRKEKTKQRSKCLICEPSENTDEQRNQSELKQSKRKQAEATKQMLPFRSKTNK